MSFHLLFPRRPAVIGMIHLQALPGTPRYQGSVAQVREQALAEAAVYARAGVDGIMLENMHDLPYLKRQVGPEVTAVMATVAQAVKAATGLPCGVQVLAGANEAALAVALAAGLDFVRVEGFVFGHVADEGWIDADAGSLLRYRRQIGAEGIAIWADIKKKHSAHAATADVDLAETARAAAFCGAEGLIVTGSATGMSTSLPDLQAVRPATDLPLLVGSGITAENAAAYTTWADGFIVGSYVKQQGRWDQPVDEKRVRKLLAALR